MEFKIVRRMTGDEGSGQTERRVVFTEPEWTWCDFLLAFCNEETGRSGRGLRDGARDGERACHTRGRLINQITR